MSTISTTISTISTVSMTTTSSSTTSDELNGVSEACAILNICGMSEVQISE